MEHSRTEAIAGVAALASARPAMTVCLLRNLADISGSGSITAYPEITQELFTVPLLPAV